MVSSFPPGHDTIPILPHLFTLPVVHQDFSIRTRINTHFPRSLSTPCRLSQSWKQNLQMQSRLLCQPYAFCECFGVVLFGAIFGSILRQPPLPPVVC